MDIRTLRQFTQLAETLHFGRASEACHVSPSALSRNIRMLEDEAGTALFERDNRRVALTPAGGLFLDYARDALAQWDAVRGTLLEQADALHGELSIYCSVTASYSFLFHLLSRFRSDHPAIEIKLHTGDPEHAMQRVQAGRILPRGAGPLLRLHTQNYDCLMLHGPAWKNCCLTLRTFCDTAI